MAMLRHTLLHAPCGALCLDVGRRTAVEGDRMPPTATAATRLAWSFSRHRLLATCERAVYWTYWGSRGLGFEPDDPDPAATARRAFALRCLTALPLLVGVAVHNATRAVVTALRDGRPHPEYEVLLAAARLTLNHAWRASQPDLIDRFWRYPGATTALREIVYRGTLRAAEVEVTRARLASCLSNLFDAALLDDLVRTRGKLGTASLYIGFDGPEQFPIVPGHDAWAALDLAYRHVDAASCDGRVRTPCWCVVDVKTGQAADAAEELLQLATYGLWLQANGYPPSDGAYLGRIVDLRLGVDRWYVLDAAALQEARDVAHRDLARLRGLMHEPERAQPLRRRAWALAADRRACRHCNFLELCGEELASVAERTSAPGSTEPRPLSCRPTTPTDAPRAPAADGSPTAKPCSDGGSTRCHAARTDHDRRAGHDRCAGRAVDDWPHRHGARADLVRSAQDPRAVRWAADHPRPQHDRRPPERRVEGG
jgi:hypothetical protein